MFFWLVNRKTGFAVKERITNGMILIDLRCLRRILLLKTRNNWFETKIKIPKRPRFRKIDEISADWIIIYTVLNFHSYETLKFSTSVELESENVYLSVCQSVCSWAHCKSQKLSNLFETWYTCRLGKYLGI